MGAYPPFYVQLKHERLKRGWSQQDVADKVGSSEKTVARWERGGTLPRPYYRQKLAEIFEITVEAFGLSTETSDEALAADELPQSEQLPSSSALPINAFAAVEATTIPVSAGLPYVSPPDSVYHRIFGYPPPMHPRTIQQREKAVEAIHTKLTQPDVTAVVLTGIAGVGKSTLAALIYHYIQEHFRTETEFFTVAPIWLTINGDVTIADVVGALFGILGKPLPDAGNLSPYSLMIMLFQALSTETQARLIVLDQFENVIDPQTGYALTEHAGFGEWLDTMNSQPSMCKMLLTSRLWPKGTREYPPTYMQEYHVEGLDIAEGVELLKKQGVETKQATIRQLEAAVVRCEGHAFALTLLASLLRRNRGLSLSLLFSNDAPYEKLWYGDIARNLLDLIYLEQLNEMQRQLLFAFSIYREGVPLQAGIALIDADSQGQEVQWLLALDMLLAQHILQASGDALYHLHAIVASYMYERRIREKGAVDRQMMLNAHAKAAQYYLRQSLVYCPPREQRKYVNDVRPFIEAVWHMCQAEQWQAAYDFMQREELYMSLRRWGGKAILLELYQQLQRFDKWQPTPDREAEISDHLGRVYSLLGEEEKALHHYTHALHLYQMIGDYMGEGRTLNHIGLIHESSGAVLEAKVFHERALGIASELGDKKGEADSLGGLGWIYHRLGQQEAALGCCEQALSIHQSIGNHKGVGDTFNCLGLIYFEQRGKMQALQYYEQSLSIRREIGDIGGEGRTLNNLGLLYFSMEQEGKAYSYYKQSLHIRREIGDRNGEGVVLFNLGKMYITRQCYDVALACLFLAHRMFEEGQNTRHEGTQRRIEIVRNILGHEVFDVLQARVEPQAALIVEQALREEAQEPV